MTVDTTNGIVIGGDCYPANWRESDIVLEHVKRIKQETGLTIENLALDAGYDVGAVHRGLEVLWMTGYVSRREFHNAAMRKGFAYLHENDCFMCMKGHHLNFEALVYKKPIRDITVRTADCAANAGAVNICRTVPWSVASPFYTAFYANMHRCGTLAYNAMKRLRAI